MMHGMSSLYDELHKTHVEINQLLEAQKRELKRNIERVVDEGGEPVSIYALVDGSGQSPMANLMVAKAQILSGMAALKAADVSSKAPRR